MTARDQIVTNASVTNMCSAGRIMRPTFSPESLSMSSPSDRRYTDSHEWFKIEGEVATLGITQFAANELTDVTYVEMRPAGTKVNAGTSVGEVESVKTTSEVYSPFSGEIVAVNADVAKDPSLLNSDPFGRGWLAKMKVENASAHSTLLDQKSYDQKYPLH